MPCSQELHTTRSLLVCILVLILECLALHPVQFSGYLAPLTICPVPIRPACTFTHPAYAPSSLHYTAARIPLRLVQLIAHPHVCNAPRLKQSVPAATPISVGLSLSRSVSPCPALGAQRGHKKMQHCCCRLLPRVPPAASLLAEQRVEVHVAVEEGLGGLQPLHGLRCAR